MSRAKRTLDLLDCAWVHACKRSKLGAGNTGVRGLRSAGIKAGVHSELCVDVSQNHVRRPISDQNGFLRTLTTSSKVYHYGKDRLLILAEHLFLQGYDQQQAVTPNTGVREMAGEAMCLPCLASIIWSLHLTKNLTEL